MEARPLPPRPSLEQYKKQAKDLLKVCRSADSTGIHAWAEAWFIGCADECAETEARLRGIALTPGLHDVIQREIVNRTEKSIQGGRLSQPNPRLADAQFLIARGHGFASWTRFTRQIHALESANSPDAKFEAAADAIVSGETWRLSTCPRRNSAATAAQPRRTRSAPRPLCASILQ